MPYTAIRATVDDSGIALITLSRPEVLNALSVGMRRDISACLRDWAVDPAVGAVVVTGAGRAFSAGFDLADFMEQERHAEILASSREYHRELWYFPKPTIAAVNGLAVGGGCDLAMLCDLRTCGEGAWFAHPELKHGAPPLYAPLAWIVGEGVARDLCLTRRRLSAAEAKEVRLVRDVHPDAVLLERTLELARLVMEAPSAALQFLKQRMTRRSADFDACLAEEHDRAFRELTLAPGRWSRQLHG